MAEKAFRAYVKDKLPRNDDKRFFDELFDIYQKEGKEGLSKYLKESITKMEE